MHTVINQQVFDTNTARFLLEWHDEGLEHDSFFVNVLFQTPEGNFFLYVCEVLYNTQIAQIHPLSIDEASYYVNEHGNEKLWEELFGHLRG